MKICFLAALLLTNCVSSQPPKSELDYFKQHWVETFQCDINKFPPDMKFKEVLNEEDLNQPYDRVKLEILLHDIDPNGRTKLQDLQDVINLLDR